MRHGLRFQGFHPEAFRFFRRLARSNHKAWFDRNRGLYQEHVMGALRALFEELVPVVLELDPEVEISGRVGRNFSRINRDIRFRPDKAPYRTNLYLFFGDRRREARDARLYLGLSGEGVTCGFAAYGGRDSALEQNLKPRRQENPQALERFLRRLRGYETYWHATERGEWKKHPGWPQTEKDWKRCRAFVVRRKFPATRRALRSPRFARTLEGVFCRLFPLYALTVIHGRPGEHALKRI
ncbi:DUF2461 domain-containing protein [Acidobacteriia bacterium AH_259_A11_L15]|nr:DUF2461 domain-containing protein [Acidobacteriia bacterium AH_259_A11_L15]